MNFLEYIDAVYSETRKNLNISSENDEFSCFIPIKPLRYSTKCEFLIKKQKHSKLFVVIGTQRVYLSDINIIKVVLSLDDDKIRWFIEQFCNLYVKNNDSFLFEVNGKKFKGTGIEFYSEKLDIILHSDSIISVNDFIFIVNFVLSKDSLWGEMKKLSNFRKLTLCKYISLLEYYAFKSKEAETFLKNIGYPINKNVPTDNRNISNLFNNDNIEKFDISLFM